tara:strand:+ start:275 stop:940 length:666 start_codon:yes stop_codon:yes gene_type:complete
MKEVTTSKKVFHGSEVKAVTDWSYILSVAEEKRRIIAEIGSEWVKGYDYAGKKELSTVYRMANREMPAGLEFGSAEDAAWETGRMAAEITRTTSKKVERIVQQGLLEGASTDQIAKTILSSTTFDTARARLIARTEATRSVNAAAVKAYETAATEGINVLKQWLASADDNVRLEHLLLDGQTVTPSELFTVDGMDAPGPGQFNTPEMDCNCRCTVIPFLVS